jgi:hypothetical protein
VKVVKVATIVNFVEISSAGDGILGEGDGVDDGIYIEIALT